MTVSKLPKDFIDQMMSDYKKPEDLLGENGILKQLTKALVERALEAEIEDHVCTPRFGEASRYITG